MCLHCTTFALLSCLYHALTLILVNIGEPIDRPIVLLLDVSEVAASIPSLLVEKCFQLIDLVLRDDRWLHIDDPCDSFTAIGLRLTPIVVHILVLWQVLYELFEGYLDIVWDTSL